MKLDALKKILATYDLTAKKMGLLAHTVLLSVWALVQFSLGNKFYGVFIIIFFLILAILRQPPFVLVALSVLVIVLFNTPTIDTLTELKRSNLITISHIKPSLDKVLRPNTGEEVLPVQVQQMLSLLRTQHIGSYQLSDQFDSDPLIMQRITESAWPIKMEATSSYFLIALAEINDYPACNIIDQREAVALADCH